MNESNNEREEFAESPASMLRFSYAAAEACVGTASFTFPLFLILIWYIESEFLVDQSDIILIILFDQLERNGKIIERVGGKQKGPIPVMDFVNA